MFTAKFYNLNRILFFSIMAVILFQNCSKVSFSGFSAKPADLSVTPNSCEAPVGPCQGAGGTGVYVCGAMGLMCDVTVCTDPDDRIIDGKCVSSQINVLINNAKSASITPVSDVRIEMNLTAAALDTEMSRVRYLSGTCAQNVLSVSELGIPGQTTFKAGSQSFTYTQALANKIAGCTWTVEGFTQSGKSSSANFTALLCVPNTVDSANPICMTQDGRSGQRTCRSDGLGYDCIAASNQNCSFNGRIVLHGQDTLAYSTSTVPYGSQCQSERRVCSNGVLSGSFTNSTCSALPAANCNLNGQVIDHGTPVKFYQQSQVPYGQTCQEEIRVCSNGVLSGSFTALTCSAAGAQNCSVNGISVPHNTTKRFYNSTSVVFGASCAYQDRTCSNGTLSGSNSFIYGNCSAANPQACNFNGEVVPHGLGVEAYSVASVPYGQTCPKETRVCSNGVLSGTYTQSGCSVGPKPLSSCTFNGQTVPNSEFVTAYQSATVPFGQQCVSEKRTCSDGTLSGAYQYSGCSVELAKTCLFNGSTVQHGQEVDAYLNASETSPQTCRTEKRKCYDGNLSGSYLQASCTVSPAPTPTPLPAPTHFIYSACKPTNDGSKIACGVANPPGYYPERVCSGKVIYGTLFTATVYQEVNGTHPTLSAGWYTIPTLMEIPGARCAISQKFGYSKPVSSQYQSYNTIYYDGPPHAGALSVTGVSAAP